MGCDGVDSIRGAIVGSSEHGKESSGSVKGVRCPYKRHPQVIRNDSAPYSQSKSTEDDLTFARCVITNTITTDDNILVITFKRLSANMNSILFAYKLQYESPYNGRLRRFTSPLQKTRVQSPAEAKDFSSSLCVETSTEAHPASCTLGTGGPFPGSERWPLTPI
jgi:hypothetical protein